MADPSPEINREDRFSRKARATSAPAKPSNTGSQKALKRADAGVVPLVPASWRRKSGRAGNLFESFYHAFHGIAIGLRDQRNLRIHFSMAVLVTIAGFAFKIDTMSWFALTIVMALVISLEFVNTSLEHLVDISANNQYHYAARCAKDTAASAVLVVSFAAMIVGMMIFVPKILALF
jgi:diacylglycerol kinase